jgi:solute carrier family 25 carnitine/acylcarnitine transporter 20/29
MYIIDVLSGVVAGMSSVTVGHPLDTIRVRLQTSAIGMQAGALAVARALFQEEGIRGFWRGITPPMVSVAVGAWAF